MTPKLPADKFLHKMTLLALLAFSISLNQLQAQTSFNTRAFNSEVKVSGTSNLHDWTMKGSGLTCEAQFTVNAASLLQLMTLNGLTFSMPVTSLKSSENLLNTRAYKAMKAESHKNIIFKLSSAVITAQGNNHYAVKAQGQLTISGVTRDVTLQATSQIQPDRTVLISGSKKMKMSDFGITPPSFMFGALKTADDITIDFNLKLNDPKSIASN
jgi:polyisoprenoid-binding protein YceI